MAGLYFHIPFCRQACHYCNFHFSTSLSHKDELLDALVAEMSLRHQELGEETIETIYFGGGTPSLLTPQELTRLLASARAHFTVGTNAEITLEANPDDLDEKHAHGLRDAGVNRLSLGIQSFHDEDLRFMNRVHSAAEALQAMELAMRAFGNVSIDLIFGTPTMSNESWQENLRIAVASGAPHMSAYALTVEDKTALAHFIHTGQAQGPNEHQTGEQFEMAMDVLGEAGYDHYEISNYAQPGFVSKHNSAYWNRSKYLGIGPSAHSFDGDRRSWNVSNNAEYIRGVGSGQIQRGFEELSTADRANETIMIGLRTKQGFDLRELQPLTTGHELDALLSELAILRSHGFVVIEDDRVSLSRSGKLLADGIISRLFV